MTKVSIPDFVNGISNKLGGVTFCGLVRCIIVDEDRMLGFASGLHDRSSIVRDSWYVSGRAGMGKAACHRANVGGSRLEDAK